jgi:hypothetical protein
MYRPTTKDQRFYDISNQLRATIDVYITREREAPSIKECRFAVLQLKNKGEGYVVYDRLLCRIVNGVFRDLPGALGVAELYNKDPNSPQDMAPNGLALGLIYPETESAS